MTGESARARADEPRGSSGCSWDRLTLKLALGVVLLVLAPVVACSLLLVGGLGQDHSCIAIGGAGLALFLAAGLGLLLRRVVLGRLRRLARTVRGFAEGDLDARAAAGGGDVLGSLARDFNGMAEGVSRLVRELREQKRHLSDVIDSLDDGLVVLEPDGRVRACNASFLGRLRRTEEEVRGRPCWDAACGSLPCRADPRECPAVLCARSGRPQRAVFPGPDDAGGPRRVEEVCASPVFDARGNVVEVVEVWRDITQRVREERRLQSALRERADLGALVGEVGLALTSGEALPEVLRRCAAGVVRHLRALRARVWTLDEDATSLTLAAAAGADVDGGPTPLRVEVASSCLGAVVRDRKAVHSDPLASDPEPCRGDPVRPGDARAAAAHPLLASGRVLGVLETHALRPLGTATLQGLASIADMIALAIERAAAEGRRALLERQFLQAQKMEAIGRLAGGVAHDFNNLLTVILGFGELGLGGMGPADPLHRPLAQIVKAGERAKLLTGQLLAFSRQQVLSPTRLDVNVVLRDLREMLERLLGEDVLLDVRPGPAVGVVRMDRTQLEQVVLNLAVNARDAMPRGGKLTIETSCVRIGEHDRPRSPDARVGPHVVVSVTDTGMGMTPEVRSHLFEPFFTTKAVGKGTGLGLSTVYGIVRQSGGAVNVYSEPGLGTTFKVYLPRLSDSSDLPAPEEATPAVGGSESILLVEDDPMVGETSREALESLGYRVHLARGPDEAIRTVDRASEAPDLLFTDVVMPGMNGCELADRLRARHPGLRVLFMSGYAAGAVEEDGDIRSRGAFLEKPFTLSSLASRLREVLDGGPRLTAA